VRRAIARLPATYREVLRLRREEGLRHEELAVRMDRSHDATRRLYARAICRLREILDEMQGAGR
jgi:DNA-directed RNA polymerase specialized sigma24 family protein